MMVLVASSLAACGADSDASPKVTASATTVPVRAVNRVEVLNGKFITHFRAAYPTLAKNVKDSTLADDAVATCNLVATSGLSRADALSVTSKQFTVNELTPSTATTAKIIKLVVAQSCSDRTDATNKLLS
jgi:hypothetical protein